MTTPPLNLLEMTDVQLTDTLFARRTAYQRALSAAKEKGDDELFEASVNAFHVDLDAIRGVPLEVTMYAATVTDRDGGFDIRGVWATKELAMERLQMEVASSARTGHVALEWDSFGNHRVSQWLAGCQYHVDPLVVHA